MNCSAATSDDRVFCTGEVFRAVMSDKPGSLEMLALVGQAARDACDLIATLDGKGHVLSWNRALEQATLWKADDILHQRLDAFIQPATDLQPLRMALLAGNAWRGELMVYGRQGDELLVDGAFSPVRDAQGALIGILVIGRDITTQRRLDTQRRRTSAQLRMMLSAIPDTFLRIDRQGTIIDAVANGPLRQMLLGTSENPRRLDTVLPDLAADLLSAVEQARTDRRTQHVTFSMGTQEGPSDLDMRVIALQDEALITVQDVTELYRLERRLGESEERFRQVVEQLRVGVFLMQDDVFQTVNPCFAEMTGYPREDLLALASSLSVFEPEARALVREHRQAGASGAPPPGTRLRVLRRDGSRLDAELYSTTTQYRGRRAILGTLVDVTQRLQQERALRESEERYRTLIGGLQEGVILFDGVGGVVMTNESACRVLETTPEDIYRHLCMQDGWHYLREDGSELPMSAHPVLLTLTTGQPLTSVTVGLKKADREIMWLSVSTRALRRDGAADPYAVVCSFFDITQRKQSEDELHRQAFYDPLTGLPNRALFLDRVQRALNTARRADRLVAVGYLDVDGFKQHNDTLGHLVADQILRQIANRLVRSVRDGDTIGRMGGDEFTILLPDIGGPTELQKVAERMLDVVRQPMTVEQSTYRVSATVGFSLFPVHGSQAGDLLRLADVALYNGKRAGKDRVVLYRPESPHDPSVSPGPGRPCEDSPPGNPSTT